MSSTTKLTRHSWAAPVMEQKGSNIGMGYTPAGVTTSSLSKHMMCGKKKKKQELLGCLKIWALKPKRTRPLTVGEISGKLLNVSFNYDIYKMKTTTGPNLAVRMKQDDIWQGPSREPGPWSSAYGN